jgi:BirA family biotin operon repressor/biotin-[acetyl-CoA-carboxylase] ligase
MRIIKLNAIDSTNSFLKEMAQSSLLENFTVIVAKEQTKGRGQMGTSWLSEANKNLLCSVFVRFDSFPIKNQVLVNYAVSIAIVNVLNKYKLSKVTIKWPNDILSSNKKMCGLLIENVMQKDEIKSSIIGIGLNVNQINFPINFNATSILKEINKETNIDDFLNQLIAELKIQISYITNSSTNVLKKNYLKYLYKKNIPTMFKDSKGVLFMGKIIDVSIEGKLQIELEDESIKEFGIKEVFFV